MSDTPRAPRGVLLHLEPGLRVPVEPDDVFLLEADGDETRVRTRGRRRLHDIRSLGEILGAYAIQARFGRQPLLREVSSGALAGTTAVPERAAISF